MTNPSWDLQGEGRAALRAIIADPHLGVAALSNPRTMSNILKDFLPDTPREASILIAAAESDVAGALRAYVAQGMDASTAQQLVSTGFAERTALTPDACRWVTSEIAVALGLSPGLWAGGGLADQGLPGQPAPTALASPAPATTPKAPGAAWQAPTAGSPAAQQFPAAGQAQPGYIQDQPQAGYIQDQPQAGYIQDQAPAGYGQPQPGYAQPGYDQVQPNLGPPQAGYGQPQPGYAQPGYDQAQPNLGPPQAGYGQAQPNLGQPQAGYGQAQPGFGQGQGGYGQAQPGYPQGQQGYTADQPGYPQGQQGYAQGQQGYVADQPGYYPGQPFPPAQAGPSASSNRSRILAGVAVGVAVVLVAVIALVLKSGPTHTGVVGQVTNVPDSTLSSVGAGQTYSSAFKSVSGAPLTGPGKPEMLYIGATFCPYCAANQWAMIVAMSKFGTFTGLHLSRSAPAPEVYPSTATLTFYGASYSSQYFTFVSVENESVTKGPQQPTTTQENTLWHRYSDGSFPFTDYGNKYVSSSMFDPSVLHNKTGTQIAAALSNPDSPIARAVDGAANMVIAAICAMTGNQPGSVCATTLITNLQRNL